MRPANMPELFRARAGGLSPLVRYACLLPVTGRKGLSQPTDLKCTYKWNVASQCNLFLTLVKKLALKFKRNAQVCWEAGERKC
jgi:hypothetical protein